MRPLRVRIDVTNGTATPAQPDPQTVHLNAAQSQQQRKEMSLPGAGLRSSQTTDPPPTQPQREEIPLPRAQLSPMGAADSSRIQSQRKEMPLPGAGMSAPPIAETPCPATARPVNSRRPLHCRLPHRVPPLLTPLAALGCCKQQISLPRRLASFAATIRGLPRTSSSAPMTLYQPL